MTGVDIKIDVDNQAVAETLQRLGNIEPYLPPLLQSIAEYAIQSTRERMAREESPDGSKFAPLNPLYAAAKKGPRILAESGTLAETLFWQMDGADAVAWGSNAIYARIHQEGGVIKAKTEKGLAFRLGDQLVQVMSVKIPARPYIGLSEADLVEIPEILVDGLLALSPGATRDPGGAA